VTGYTLSTNFPILNAVQPTKAGLNDAFVTRLDAAGAPVYSTYLGGISDDYGRGIAVDGSGNAYVTGETYSTDYPTLNAVQATFGGGFVDAFVTKLDAAGALSYSTFLGGTNTDAGYGIAVDASGNAYVTGSTYSLNYPTLLAAQATRSGSNDAFITKLNAAGALVYSTYLGGTLSDQGYGIAVDAFSNAYVTGFTTSTDYPILNAFQPLFGGFNDAFITKLNALGALSYSTYLGGIGDDRGYAIAVDASGNAYVAGSSGSTNFPTVNAIQPTFAGSYDAFVTKLDATGAPSFSTYLGGAAADFAFGAAVDASGNAYVAGNTTSTNFPTTANAVQPTFSGLYSNEAFITKIDALNNPPLANAGVGSTVECDTTNGVTFAASNVTLDGSASSDPDGDTLTYTWSHPTLGTLGTGSIIAVALPGGANTITLQVDDGRGGTAADTVVVNVVDTISPFSMVAGPDVTLEATSIAGAPYDPLTGAGAGDVCDATLQYSATPAPANYPFGSTPVTVRATDDSGNFAEAVKGITVQDTTAPSFVTPPADITGVEASSVFGFRVSYPPPAAVDSVDATPTVICSPYSTTYFPLGNTTVTCIATDHATIPNTASVQFTVNVVDTTPPTITPPGLPTKEATGPLTSVNIGTLTATDIFGIQSIVNDAPAAFPVGLTDVIWTVKDNNGNTNSYTQRVTVTDTTPPALTIPVGLTEQLLQASDATNKKEFGKAVAMDGNFAIVGTPIENGKKGAAYIFERDPTTGVWSEVQKLTAATTYEFWGGNLGKSVAIAGDMAVLGAPSDATTATGAGAVFVFKRDAVSGVWSEAAKLLASDGQFKDYFGQKVGISGNTILVGAPSADAPGASSGKLYVFRDDGLGNWSETQQLLSHGGINNHKYGTSIAMQGNRAMVSAKRGMGSLGLVGSVHVLELNTTTDMWEEVAEFSHTTGVGSTSSVGEVVAFDGDIAVMSAPALDPVGLDSGGAYVFERQPDGTWLDKGLITAADGVKFDRFGDSLAVSGGLIAVGAQLHDEVKGKDFGAVYFYKKDSLGNWVSVQKLFASDGAAKYNFGNALAMQGQQLLVGSKLYGATGFTKGAVYAYQLPGPVPAAMTFEANAPMSTLVLPTVFATDLVDGDRPVTDNEPATFPLGNTPVDYSASDLSGNIANATIVVTVQDTIKPTITRIGAATINLNAGDVYVDQGATATDIYDDDATLTALIVTLNSVDTNIPGTYYVRYNVSDSNGNVATEVTRKVVVANVAPVVSAGLDAVLNEGSLFSQNGTFTDLGASWTGTVDYGDGGGVQTLTVDSFAKSFVLSHTYADNGAYTATVNIKDSGNLTGTDTILVTVNNVAPVVNAGPDQVVNEGNTVNFSGSFTDPGTLDTHSYNWDFGDASTDTTGLTPSHFYTADGVYTVTLTVTDNDLGAGSNTMIVTVNNVAPVAMGDAYSVDEDNILNVAAAGVLANDTDAGNDPLTAVLVAGPANGALTLNADGSFSYTPNANFNGGDSFTYNANDGAAGSNIATVTLTVNAVNDAPVAVADAYSTDEDTALNIAAAGVLSNDSDVEGDPLSAVLASGPANGILTLNADGSFTYMPNANFNGGDSFTYNANDSALDSNVVTVAITVNAVNDAPTAVDDSDTTAEDTMLTTVNVLANDSDIDGDAISLVGADAFSAQGGQVVDNRDGTFNYSPSANFNGADSFKYSIADGSTRFINPVAGTGTNSFCGDGGLATAACLSNPGKVAFDAAGNMYIPDGTNYRIRKVDVATGIISTVVSGLGQVSAVVFDAAGNMYIAEVHQIKKVNAGSNVPVVIAGTGGNGSTGDGGPATAAQTGYIDDIVLDASDNIYLTNRVANKVRKIDAVTGIITTIAGTGLTGSTGDGGDAVLATLNGAHGLAIDPLNNTLYVSEMYGLRVRAVDLSTGIISLAAGSGIGGDGGLAVNASLSTPLGLALDVKGNLYIGTAWNGIGLRKVDAATGIISTLIATGVSAGDGGPIASASVHAPQYLAINAKGHLYISELNTSQKVRKIDIGASSTATVNINVSAVNDAPVATDDTATTAEDSAATITVLANDSDVDGDALTVSAVGIASNGTVSTDGTTVSYAPNANFNGPDSFTYDISDGNGGTATATVHVAVTAVNDAPVFTNPATNPYMASTDEDSMLNFTATASDVDIDVLHFNILAPASHGLITINGASGSVSYMPAANYNGLDAFTLGVTDGNGGFDSVVVNVTVLPVNDVPVANNDASVTDEDTAVTVSVLGNDSDIDGDALTVSVVGTATNGSVTTDGSTVTYTPAANFNGGDSFTYDISDGNGGTATAMVTITVTSVNDAPVAIADAYGTDEDVTLNIAAGVLSNDSDGTLDSNIVTVSLTVNAVNDAPVAVADAATTAEDTAATISVLANDSDVDGDALTVTAVGVATNGTVTTDGTSVVYTPNANYNGPDSFTYDISDGNGGTATATVAITVTAVNDAPVAINDAATTAEDTAATITVLANDSDVDGDALTVTAVGVATNGTVTTDGTSVVYTPNANYNGPDSFTYDISDGNGGTATATVNVTVNAVNDQPVITMNGTSPVIVEGGSTYIDAGASAADVEDGDISANIVVNNPVNTAVPGSYTVTYDVSDTAGNPATQVTRSVTVADTTAPTITMTGTSPVTVEAGSTYIDAGATASDIVDGDLTSSIVVTSTVNTAVPGSYTVTYDVSDTAGNTSTASRTVIVVNAVNNAPIAVDDVATTTENTAVTVNVLVNDSDPDGDALTVSAVGAATNGTVTTDGTSVIYSPNANYSGSDSFTYDISDGNGGIATATVNVTITAINDTTPPVLTIPGNITVDATGLLTVVDIGIATAVDDSPVTITSDAPVDGFPIGDTTVTWTATDTSGNASTAAQIITVDAKLSAATLSKAEVEWRELTDETGVKYGMTEIKAKGELVLPIWMPLSAITADADVSIGLAGIADLMNQNVAFTVKGDKWKYKVKTAIGLKELEIKWKGAEFEFKDAASGVKLETEGDDLDSTSLSVDVKGHEVMLLVNGQTLSVSAAGIVTSPYPFDQDEDGEVTFELPFELTSATIIQLTIDGVVQDVAVGTHYTPAQGKFELKAEVNAGSLTGAVRPATLDIGLSLGSVAMDGTASVSSWSKLSNKEWKLKH
jgi:hypothetical protein